MHVQYIPRQVRGQTGGLCLSSGMPPRSNRKPRLYSAAKAAWLLHAQSLILVVIVCLFCREAKARAAQERRCPLCLQS